jgi:hypothetical protein
MHPLLLISPLLLLLSSTLADLIYPRAAPLFPIGGTTDLSRRQTNPHTCTGNTGETIYIYANEVCCQYLGSPFTCSTDNPYCCPPVVGTNEPLCGSSAACAGPILDGQSSSVKSIRTAQPSVPTNAVAASTSTPAAVLSSTQVAGGNSAGQTTTAGGVGTPTAVATATLSAGALAAGGVEVKRRLMIAITGILVALEGLV